MCIRLHECFACVARVFYNTRVCCNDCGCSCHPPPVSCSQQEARETKPRSKCVCLSARWCDGNDDKRPLSFARALCCVLSCRFLRYVLPPGACCIKSTTTNQTQQQQQQSCALPYSSCRCLNLRLTICKDTRGAVGVCLRGAHGGEGEKKRTRSHQRSERERRSVLHPEPRRCVQTSVCVALVLDPCSINQYQYINRSELRFHRSTGACGLCAFCLSAHTGTHIHKHAPPFMR